MDDAKQKALNDRIRDEAGDSDCVHGVKLRECTRCFVTIANDLGSNPDKRLQDLVQSQKKD